MMDVEIDHRNALETVHGARMKRSGSDIVEQAESHRLRRCGVMPGRAHSTKRILHFARHDHIDTEHDRPGSAKRRITGSRRCERVGIQARKSGFGNRPENVTDVSLRMCASQRFQTGFRRFPADQSGKFGRVESIQDVLKPCRTLRMSRRQFMFQAVRMSNQRGRHLLGTSDDFEVVESLHREFIFQRNI